MNIKVEKQPKASIKLTITVEVEKVKQSYEAVLEEKVKTVKIEGFREGKAPKQMVEEKLGVSNLYGDVVNNLLQTYYIQAVKENHIIPLSNPRIEIKEFDLEKDFEFTAEVAVKPDVKINKTYKTELKKIFKNKVEETKKAQKEDEKNDHPHVHIATNEIINVLVKESEVEVADLLVEDETNRMMSRLVNQAQSIGLSLDQYLKSQNKTAEDLRKDYGKIAENNIKAEFILGQLVTDENIEVTDDEVLETIKAAGVAESENIANDPSERFYVKTILQKNKLISKLMEEAEDGYYKGDEGHEEDHKHEK